MSCANCSNPSCPSCESCECPQLADQRTQRVLAGRVVIRTRTVSAADAIESDDDVIDVVAAGVVLTLPDDPVPLKPYRIVANGGAVSLVDSAGNAIGTVPAGTSRDFLFSDCLCRWVGDCCGDAGPVDLEDLIGPQGIAGLTGALGPQGVAGLVGAVGPIGVAGLVGLIGPQGIAGLIGEIGIPGIAGIVGPQGVAGLVGAIGLSGPTGATGPAGPAGPAGATGATGAAGGVLAFSEFYALMPPDNPGAGSVDPDEAVEFPNNGPTDGVIVRTGPDTFLLPAIGVYRVTFQASVAEAGQLLVSVNGDDVLKSVVGRATGTTQIVGSSLIQTTSVNSILEIKNPAGNSTALSLTPIAGGTRPVSANLVIEQIA